MQVSPPETLTDWGVFGTFLLLVLGPAAIFSKEGASRFWLLGKFRDYVKNRKIREIQEASRLADIAIDAHRRDRELWRSQLLDALKERNREAEQSQRYWGYIVFVAAWDRQLRIDAARYGWEPPPGELQGFEEWLEKYWGKGD